jgi:hypothetical protein
MKEIKIACEQTIKCMEALVNQNAQVAEKFQQMFPANGEFGSVGTVRNITVSRAKLTNLNAGFKPDQQRWQQPHQPNQRKADCGGCYGHRRSAQGLPRAASSARQARQKAS